MVSGTVLDKTITLMRLATIVFLLNVFVSYCLAYFQAINKNELTYAISIILNLCSLPFFYWLSKAF